jgi:thiol-disulfide isomerase/thioredoxin
MKNLLSFFIILFYTNSVLAQSQTPKPIAPKATIKLDQNAQVRDANGMEYPYAVWRNLSATGKYSFKLIDGKNPEAPIFMIFELSPQEIEARKERMPKPMASNAFKDGDDFKYFSFRDTDNQKFKVEDLKGKVLVVNFWFINCPPCRAEIPDLNEMVEQYKDNKDVIFVAVGLDPWFDLKEYLVKQPFKYHLVTDGRYYATEQNVNNYPTNVVVDRNGKVAFQSMGGSPATTLWMKRAIDAALIQNN